MGPLRSTSGGRCCGTEGCLQLLLRSNFLLICLGRSGWWRNAWTLPRIWESLMKFLALVYLGPSRCYHLLSESLPFKQRKNSPSKCILLRKNIQNVFTEFIFLILFFLWPFGCALISFHLKYFLFLSPVSVEISSVSQSLTQLCHWERTYCSLSSFLVLKWKFEINSGCWLWTCAIKYLPWVACCLSLSLTEIVGTALLLLSL